MAALRQVNRLGALLCLAWGLACSERSTDVVSSSAAPSTPPTVDATGSLFWLDARAGLSFREGGAALWVDQSSSQRHATQIEPARRPDAGAWVENDQPVPEFGGDDELLLPRLDFNAELGLTLVLLLRRSDDGASLPLLLRSGDGASPFGIELIAPGGIAINERGTLRPFEGVLNVGQAALVLVRFDPSQGKMELRVNGVLARPYSSGGPKATTRDNNRLGVSFRGQIAFAALLLEALSSETLEALERDLAASWGCCAD